MSLIRTLLEGLGTARFVEGRLLPEVQAPGETPLKVPPLSPLDELELLEKKALERGLSLDELTATRQIGNCPAQVRTRIAHLHKWLAAH